jgi:hypothetical protein
MPEAIRTRYEFYVDKLLNFLEIPHQINQILCFTCSGAYFYWSDSSLPEQCAVGLHRLTKGDFARPDFILGGKKFPMPVKDKSPISVLRIDGGIHDKRIQMKKDKAQERCLRDLHIPYFVSENEFWCDNNGKFSERVDWARIPARHLDYLLGTWVQTIHPSIYKKYQDLKEIKDGKLV